MGQLAQSQTRTRMFARAFGPFFLLVPSIIAVRASSQMPVLVHAFANDPMWQWVLGAMLLLWGSVIIAFHQYWRSPAAVVVSLLGWILAIEGVLILAVPHIYTTAGNALEGAIPLVRAIFGGLALVGLYLTYIGWVATPSKGHSSESAQRQDRPYATDS